MIIENSEVNEELAPPEVECVDTKFTYKIPDDFRESSFELGLTGEFTYSGPRYLTFEIENETGKETGWCLVYPAELERPCALDSTRVIVDCSLQENGLLCEIANDQGDPRQVEFRAERTWVTYFEAPEGYTSIEKPTDYEPRDIYDEFNITYDFDTEEFNIPIHDWETDFDQSMTWDNFKTLRNNMLADTDGAYTDDMPDEIKNKWIKYRQLLRDSTTALAEFEPYIAIQMMPPMPVIDPE